MNGRELVGGTAEPAFAVDSQGRILAWNSAAERLFGHQEAHVLNRRCWKVLSGRDAFGNRYCHAGCPLIRMALRNEPINRCDLYFYTAARELQPVGVSTMAFNGRHPSGLTLVHLLCPLPSLDPFAGISAGKLCPAHEADRLTMRETEVLALVAEGRGTREMADGLGLSTATVRNHIDHVLKKLKVHSRLQAVILAQRLGLIRRPERVRSTGASASGK